MALLEKAREAIAAKLAETLLAGIGAILVAKALDPFRWLQHSLESFGTPATASLVLVLTGTVVLLLAYVIVLKPWLRFDPAVGAWMNRRNRLYYCTKCVAEKRGYVPMKRLTAEWICPACNLHYPDPNAPPSAPQPLLRKIRMPRI